MTSKKTNDWTPATSFTLKKLRAAGPKPGQSVNAYMYGRAKGDAEWATMSVNYSVTKKKQVRKPRWTIKRNNQEQK
tara:strand:+ start:1533 stop:1760 length:228 start_codon:yes stop_codon:yes gene_type:complete